MRSVEIFQLISVVKCAINIFFSWHTLWLRLYSYMSSGANLCSLYTWHGTLNTVHGCFEKLLHTYHMQFKSCAWTLQRNIGLSSKLNALQIRTCVNLRTAVVQFWDGIRKKSDFFFFLFACFLGDGGRGRGVSDSLWAVTCHIHVTKGD